MSNGFELDDFDSVDIPEHDRGIPKNDPGPTSAELELVARRELALEAKDAVADVLGKNVTITSLQLLTKSETPAVRLGAVRALRAVAAVAREGSAVVAAVGTKGIYHYVEGVVTYGASENCYLSLVSAYGMDAEGVTALYEIREQVAGYCNGRKPGFRTLHNALTRLGINPHEAAADPDGAVAAMEAAGYFIDHIGNSERSRIFDHPVFAPGLSENQSRVVDDDIDGSVTRGILEGFRDYFNRLHDMPEELED